MSENRGGGRMLVGDIPNVDKNHRFLLFDLGKKFITNMNNKFVMNIQKMYG